MTTIFEVFNAFSTRAAGSQCYLTLMGCMRLALSRNRHQSFRLTAGILTYWGSGRLAPRLPPRGRLVPPGSGGVAFCVRPPPSRGCARVLTTYSASRCGYPCWLKLYLFKVPAQAKALTSLRQREKLRGKTLPSDTPPT